MEFTKDVLLDFISNMGVCVLATSSNDRITARTMSVISDGFNIYLNTDRRFLKFKQIEENKNAALCKDNYQMEGVAKILGHPRKEEFFSREYEKQHPSSFKQYSHLEHEVVIKIELKRIQIWEYVDKEPCVIIYDVDKDELVIDKYEMK